MTAKHSINELQASVGKHCPTNSRAPTDPKLRDYWTNSPTVEKKAIKWNADFWGAKAADGTTNEEFAQQKLNQLLSR